MELITRSDDERLAHEGFLCDKPGCNECLLARSLRAALEKIEVQRFLQADFDALVIQYERREADLDAALAQLADEKQKVANLEEYMLKGVAFRDELQAQLAEKERQLCKAWGLLDDVLIERIDESPPREWMLRVRNRDIRDWFRELDAALSSSSPCRHAAEADALRSELSVAMAASKAKVSNELLEMMEEICQEETVGCTEHEIKIITEFMEGFRKLAKDNRELLSAELRRRTGGEG